MAFLFVLLTGTHAQYCYDFSDKPSCNATTLPCSWESTCAAIDYSLCDISDPATCLQTPGCNYTAGECGTICDNLDATSCAANANACVSLGSCNSLSCAAFNAPCPSSCVSPQPCGPAGGFDTCTTHSAAICGTVSGCTWKNGLCQSPCWGQSANTCTTMQGCELSDQTCSDPGFVYQCMANLTTDCESNYWCNFNQSGTGVCEVSCGYQNDQLGCASSSGCMWIGTCSDSTYTCGTYSDGSTCNQDSSCSWNGLFCSSKCSSSTSSTDCSAMAGCNWQGSCGTNYNSKSDCFPYSDPVDCTDTSTGRNCQLSSMCQPLSPSSACFTINDAQTCGSTAGCSWASPFCIDTCYEISAENQCTSASGCKWTTQCESVTVNPITPPCPTFNEADCTSNVNSQFCSYQPGCSLTGGGGAMCYDLQNATACWANSDCYYGAGQCFPRCSFLTQTQCASEGSSGCVWQSSCTYAGQSVNIGFGDDPNSCSIDNSPVFPNSDSPCADNTCSAAWGAPTYTSECNALAKAYCCGTNSTTCAQDNQCFEKYFGDGPLCNWKCDFETAVTHACQSVGQCSTTSVAYSHTADFSTNSMALFDLSLSETGLAPPIVKNGALCANSSDSQNPSSGLFWKDDLNGDLSTGTTISFDFTTHDFSLAFGVIFSTAHAVQVAETSQDLDSFGDCVYVAGCLWNTQSGSGCNLVLGNTLGGFKYSIPTVTGPWVDLVPGTTYHASIVKSATFAITLTVSGPGIQATSVGPINVGRKFTRFGLMMLSVDPAADTCIDNLSVTSSTCPTDTFSTAAPVASLPTMAPISRAPTTKAPIGPPTTHMPTMSPTTQGPTAPPTTRMPTMSPTTHAPTAAPVPTTTAPSSPPTTPAPSTKLVTKTSAPKKSASAPLGSFLSIVLVAVGCLLF